MLELVKSLCSVLSNSSAIQSQGVTGIFEELAPLHQATPYIIITEQSSLDEYSHDRRAATEYVYSIKCVDDSRSPIRSRTVSESIDSALTLQPLTVSGYSAFFVRRTSQFSYTEGKDNQFYRHRGGLYAMMLSPDN